MEENGKQKVQKMISKNNKVFIWFLVLFVITIALSYFIVKMPEIIKKEPKEMLDLVEEGIYDQTVYANEYAKLDVALVTDNIATYESGDTTKYYYIAYDANHYMYIVELTYKVKEQLSEINQYTYGEIEQAPEPIDILGTTKAIPDELKKIVVEEYNKGYEEELLTEENFEGYFGNIYLDTSQTPYTNYETIGVLVTIFLGIYALILFVQCLSRKRVTSKTIKKLKRNNELDTVYNELESTENISFNHIDCILTKNYIVDATYGLRVYKYDEIKWLYLYKHRINFAEVERAIIIKTKNLKDDKVAKIKPSKKRNEEHEKLCEELFSRCPESLQGFTNENKKLYKEYKKDAKKNK